jgi:hypothetical protein
VFAEDVRTAFLCSRDGGAAWGVCTA